MGTRQLDNLATALVFAASVLAGCTPTGLDLGSTADNDGAAGDNVGLDAASPIAVPCTSLGALVDGGGYLADIPLACSESTGAEQSFTTPPDVASALVGVWTGCASGTDAFVLTIDRNARGIEFTDDGQFFIMVMAQTDYFADATIVRATDPGSTGTFEVIDASASLGPGTFQVRLTAASGGVYLSQVVVYGPPAKVRFFAPSSDDYVPAISKSYQANVCGPTLGPLYTPTSDDDLLQRIVGRWARCDNPLTNGFGGAVAGQGVEFPGDGTWYALVVDDTEQLVRSTDPTNFGTIQVSTNPNAGPFSFEFLSGSGADVGGGEPIVDSCGGLSFAAGVTEGVGVGYAAPPGFDAGAAPPFAYPVPGYDAGSILSYEYRRLP